MDVVNLGIIAYFLGILLSFGYPYLIKWLNTGEAFDWRRVVSQVLGGIVAGLIAIVAPGFIEQLTDIASAYDYQALYFISVMLMSYGAGSLGNTTENLGRAVLKKD